MSLEAATAISDMALTSVAVCRAAGVTFRLLDRWCRLDVLHPTAVGGWSAEERSGFRPGSGSKRMFTHREVRVAALVGRLADLGVSTEVLRLVASDARGWLRDDWHGALLVSKHGTTSRLAPGVPATFGEACWIVNLDLCVQRFARSA